MSLYHDSSDREGDDERVFCRSCEHPEGYCDCACCNEGDAAGWIGRALVLHPDACEHGVRLKNHCAACARLAARLFDAIHGLVPGDSATREER